jgi:hypothetical protein
MPLEKDRFGHPPAKDKNPGYSLNCWLRWRISCQGGAFGDLI